MQDDYSVQPRAAVRLRLEGPIFALLEDWRRSHEKIPSRSEALRLLIELALAARPDGARPPEPRRRLSALSRAPTNSTQKFEGRTGDIAHLKTKTRAELARGPGK
jgi:hypothetical protein